MKIRNLLITGCMLWAVSIASAQASSMLGDTGAAVSSPFGASVNPANAAYVDRTTIESNPNVYSIDKLQVRYPGFRPIEESSSGIGFASLLTGTTFIYKVNQKIGIGGRVAPPGIGLPIEVQQVPLVLLKRVYFLDILGEASLNGLLDGTFGYRVSRNFGIGLSVNFLSANISADVTPSGGGQPLLSLAGTLTTFSVGAGVRWDVKPGVLSLGLASKLYQSTSLDLTIDSALLEGAGFGGDLGGSGAGVALKSIVGGFQARVKSINIMMDAEYTRNPAGSEQVSLSDLKSRPKDVHDTLGLRGGLSFKVKDKKALMGFRYEPASVGQGSISNELNGFGSIDVLQLFIPFVAGGLKPYWMIASGLEFPFGKVAAGRAKKKGDRVKYFHKWNVALGLGYKRASFGSDEDGELPGAYLQTSLFIPARILYKF